MPSIFGRVRSHLTFDEQPKQKPKERKPTHKIVGYLLNLHDVESYVRGKIPGEGDKIKVIWDEPYYLVFLPEGRTLTEEQLGEINTKAAKDERPRVEDWDQAPANAAGQPAGGGQIGGAILALLVAPPTLAAPTSATTAEI